MAPLLPPIITALGNALLTAVESLAPLLPPIIESFVGIVEALLPLLPAILPLIPPLLQLAAQIFPILGTIIETVVLPAIKLLTGAIEGIVGVVTTVTDSIGGFADWLGGIWGGVEKDTTSTFDNMSKSVSGSWDSIEGATTDAASRTQKATQSAWDDIGGSTDKAWSGVGSTVDGAWGDIQRSSDTGAGDLTQVFRRLPADLVGALGDIGSLLWNSGASLVTGFLDGIRANWDRLTRWVSDGMGRLRNLWPFSPAKEGPFSGRGYVTYSGQALTEDFARAITAGMGGVIRSAQGLMSGLSGVIANGIERDADGVVRSTERLANRIVSAADVSAAGDAIQQVFDRLDAAAIRGGDGSALGDFLASTIEAQLGNVTIQTRVDATDATSRVVQVEQQPVPTAEEIARALARELARAGITGGSTTIDVDINNPPIGSSADQVAQELRTMSALGVFPR
ncbi:hypothetical protein BJF78_24685 [Pseudonocardia sp. CNS-139]|nr:hypothetical protein BJF78_24685 [Pseudonocardia sp. CNS-139]